MKSPTPFGNALSDLIREVYESRKAFAQQTGYSQAELSQLISGKRSDITPRTLKERLFPAFPKLHHQQRLWETYVATYLPSPVEDQSPKSTASDTQVENYLASTYWLSQGSHTLSVFETTRELWSGLRAAGRSALALRAGHAFVSSTFSLVRKAEGLLVAREMRRLAMAEHDQTMVAKALWLEATCMPDNAPVSKTASLYRDFSSYVADWHGKSITTSPQGELAHMSLRDAVVFLTRCVDDHKASPDALTGALNAFQPALARLDDRELFAIGKFVETEALLALGQIAKVEESLEEIKRIPTPNHPRQPLKIQSIEARWLLASGQRSEAWNLAIKALDECDRQGYIHGHITISALTREIIK